ncbi:hypothetical protein C8Q76DRAFT_343525 [Earliella scabrosa]|nr:hypothetical protein C8Q76DRAFT_343525 [Earliella scabrosa]
MYRGPKQTIPKSLLIGSKRRFLQYMPHWGTKYHQIHREDDDDHVEVVMPPTYHVFRVEQPITRGCGVEVLQDINTASAPEPHHEVAAVKLFPSLAHPNGVSIISPMTAPSHIAHDREVAGAHHEVPASRLHSPFAPVESHSLISPSSADSMDVDPDAGRCFDLSGSGQGLGATFPMDLPGCEHPIRTLHEVASVDGDERARAATALTGFVPGTPAPNANVFSSTVPPTGHALVANHGYPSRSIAEPSSGMEGLEVDALTGGTMYETDQNVDHQCDLPQEDFAKLVNEIAEALETHVGIA